MKKLITMFLVFVMGASMIGGSTVHASIISNEDANSAIEIVEQMVSDGLLEFTEEEMNLIRLFLLSLISEITSQSIS